jgi:hypothetical protein
MIFAQNANKEELLIAIEHGVWGSFNANKNFANPAQSWEEQDDYWNNVVGSYLFVTVTGKPEFCVFRIDSLPSDDIPNPWGVEIHARIKVTPLTSLINLPNGGLTKTAWQGARGLTRVGKHKLLFEKWLEDTHYRSNSAVAISTSSSEAMSDEKIQSLFAYPIEYWGTMCESGNTFVGKQYRQSGGTNLITYLILKSFYQSENPTNVCVLFAGDRSSHSSQWCYDLNQTISKIDHSIRPLLFGSVKEFVNSRKDAHQSGKPIIVVGTYKDYTQVKELINPLSYDNLRILTVFDEMQKVYVNRGKEHLSYEKQDRGDIHRMLQSVVEGKYWNTVASIFMSGTPFSAGFKEFYSDRPGSWIWKPTHTVDEGGEFTSIAQMNTEFRDDEYWQRFKTGDFCEQAKLDLLYIPCYNKIHNIVPVNVGTKMIKDQHDLAFAIKNLRDNDNQWGSFYAVYNGSDGFTVIGNTIDQPLFSMKGVSPKEAINEFRATIPNAKDAMLLVITDVMSSVNVSYRDLTDTSLCYAQFMNYSDSRVEANGLEDGIQLIRCEGYLNGFKPTLFIEQEFYEAAVEYDRLVEAFFLDNIDGSLKSIVDREYALPKRMINRLHHTKHKVEKHTEHTIPDEPLKSTLLELRCDDNWITDGHHKTIKAIEHGLLKDYCLPGFADRWNVKSRNSTIEGETSSRSIQCNNLILRLVKDQDLYCRELDKFDGTIRFIEGDSDYKKSGGGNDWSVYGKANWAKVYQSEGQYRKDRFRKIIWWYNAGSVLVRIMQLDGEVGLIHDFDGVPRAFHYNPEVTHQTFSEVA